MLDRLQPALLWLGCGGDKVDNRTFARREGVGKTAAGTLNVKVVATGGGLFVGRSGMSSFLFTLEFVLTSQTVCGSCLGIVVGDNLVSLAGEVDWNVLAVEKRAERNVPEPHSSVALDKTASEVGNEEDVPNGKDTKEDTEDKTSALARAHFLEALTSWILVNDEQSENSSSKSKVEWD